MDPAPDVPSPVPPPDTGTPAKPRRRRRGCLWILAILAVAYIGWEAVNWPDVAWYADHDPNTSAFVERYRRRAKREGLPPVRQRWIAYRSISRNLKQAVVAAEDMEFFDHHGFSSHELQASLQDAWEEKSLPRGASTISQQTAKNLWLSPSYNPLRKVKEAVLTWQLERNLEKRRILELYLNFAEFGPGTYGAEAAARRYFGVSASRLTAGQAARLAAGLSRPRSWHPGAQSRSYERRVRIVLRRMAQARWILRNV